MLSDVVFWLGTLLAVAAAIATGVQSLVLWRRSGFRAPAYIHALALLALALGLFIAWGEHQGERRIWLEATLVCVLPVLVYWAYLAGGGPAQHLASQARGRHPNGLRAGARLRLRHDLPGQDAEGRTPAEAEWRKP